MAGFGRQRRIQALQGPKKIINPNIKTRLLLGAGNVFIHTYNYLLQNTCSFHLSKELDDLLKSSEPAIIAVLHQDALSTYAFLLKHATGKRLCSLSSLSKDGEIAAYFMESMGIKTVRGSSSREGLRGLLEMARLIREDGYSVIFPCDGPRRPFGIVKPGVLMLSSITGIPIYLLRSRTKHQFVLQKTPPKLFLPRPFSEISAWEIGPIQVKRRCTRQDLNKYLTELQHNFDKLQTDSYFRPRKFL